VGPGERARHLSGDYYAYPPSILLRLAAARIRIRKFSPHIPFTGTLEYSVPQLHPLVEPQFMHL